MQSTRNSNRLPHIFLIVGVAMATAVPAVHSLDQRGPSVEPPILAPPPDDILKNRYISLDSRGATGQNVGFRFDIRLTLTGTQVDSVPGGQIGSQWWAGCPDANCISLVGPNRPASGPDWFACPTVHLTGCAIIPTALYDIVVIDDQGTESAPLAATTQLLPADNKWWGDAVGAFDGASWSGPQGVTNFDDVTASLKTFQDPNAINATHVSVTDLHPNRPDLGGISVRPNRVVNIDDVFQFIQAFQGAEYPGGDVGLCPDEFVSCPEFCEIHPEGSPCDDGDFCTFGDSCQVEECIGVLDPLCPALEPGTKSNEYAMPGNCINCAADSGVTGLIDPVYLFSGEFYESNVDLQIPGRGIDFVWGRKYRSQVGPNTAMGNGWDFSYNIYLEDPMDGSDNLILHNGDTRQDIYVLQADGTWTRREFFRVIEANPNPTMDPFTLTFSDTGKWVFHPFNGSPEEGKILEINDRNDNTISFTYDGFGRIVTIHDPLDTTGHNRDITIDYDGPGAGAHIVAVNDFAGRSVTYTYYTGEPGGNVGDLMTVTTPFVVNAPPDFPVPSGHEYPLGKTTKYTYSPAGNLLTITDPKDQKYLTNEYDASGRVIRQFWGNQDDTKDPDTIDIVYVDQVPSASNNFAVIKVIVNDRVGNVKELFFDSGNRGVIEREYTGRADADLPTTETENRPTGQLRPSSPRGESGDPAFFETTYQYNNDSLRTKKVDANGNQIVSLFDNTNTNRRSQGNLLQECSVPNALLGGDQAQISESYEYEDGFGGCCGTNFVTMHVDGRGHETLNTYDARGNRLHTQHRISSIVEDFEYNEFGQMTAHVHPRNGPPDQHRRRDEYTYYDSGPQFGYLHQEIVDAPNFDLTTTYAYNKVGQVISVTDPRGHDTLYVVNQLDQVERRTSREVTDGTNVRYDTDVFYDLNDNVVRVDIENLDEIGNLPASGNTHFTTIYEYEILNFLTRTCREVGDLNLATTVLDCSLTTMPFSDSIHTAYEYDANRNRTLVRYGEATNGNQPNNVVETLYDERDLTFRVIRAPGDPDQSTTRFDYDQNRNLIRTSQGIEDLAAPRITTNTYDGFDRLVAAADPMGNVTEYRYDPNNNVGGFQDAGETVRNPFAVRVDGELNDVQGSAGNVRLSETWIQYDDMDRVTLNEVEFFDADTQTPILIPGVPTPGKVTTVTEWSDNSQVIRMVNDNLHETRTAYDTANRESVVTDHLDNTITYTYDNNSNIIETTTVERSDIGNPDELFTTTYTYDNLDRLIQTEDNVGNMNDYAHDSRDNRTFVDDALGHKTRRAYDGINRLITTNRDLDGDGADGDGPDITTTQIWDGTSRLTGQGDDHGNIARYAYDALDRLIVTQMADGTIHQIGEGAVWPKGEPEPDLSGFSSGLDVHDNKTLMTDANNSVADCQYDLLDRRSRIDVDRATISDGDLVDVLGTTFEDYEYDGLSRLIYAEDDDSVVTRSHNSLSRVTRETLNIQETDDQTTTCLFDGVGNELESIYPGGRMIECTYDALERMKTITDTTGGGGSAVASYDYVGPGRVERREYGNGARTDFAYDGIRELDGTPIPNPANDFGVKRIIGMRHTITDDPAGACLVDGDCPVGRVCDTDVSLCVPVIDDRTFTWDEMYNKKQRNDIRSGGPHLTHAYTYDDIYRLVRTVVTNPVPSTLRDTTYDFDGVSNRTEVMGTPDPGQYFMDPTQPDPADFQMNQYTTTSADARIYDDNGNLIRIDGLPTQRDIKYDFRNQMVEYFVSTGERHAYFYDALGRRIAKVVDVDGVTGGPIETRYFYDGWRVCEEQDSDGATLATYVYGLYIDEELNMQRNVFTANLVVNGDFSLGNTGFTSDAQFVAPPATTNPGEYSLRSDPSTANGAWCGFDHTTGTGDFLICDGITGSETVAWRQTIPVNSGESYLFSAWVINLVCDQDLADPDMELRVDGVPIAGPLSLPENPDQWELLSAPFTAAGATVLLEVVSTSTTMNGNDFGIDDISVVPLGAPGIYYHTDDLCNVLAITGDDGVVLERYEYQDYGEPLVFNGAGAPIGGSAIGNPYLFTGRRYDPETGWYYYRTRYLDPRAGRFTTRDRVGSNVIRNSYTYVRNRPTVFVDPLGLQGKAAGGVGATAKFAAKVVVSSLDKLSKNNISVSGDSASAQGQRGSWTNRNLPACSMKRRTYTIKKFTGVDSGLYTFMSFKVQLYFKWNGCDVAYLGVQVNDNAHFNSFWGEANITGKSLGLENFVPGRCRCCKVAVCLEYEVRVDLNFSWYAIGSNDSWFVWKYRACGDGLLKQTKRTHSDNVSDDDLDDPIDMPTNFP